MLGKLFIDCLLVLASSNGGRAIVPKLSVSISRVSVEGLKLVILSADFLLNRSGFWIILLVFV